MIRLAKIHSSCSPKLMLAGEANKIGAFFATSSY